MACSAHCWPLAKVAWIGATSARWRRFVSASTPPWTATLGAAHETGASVGRGSKCRSGTTTWQPETLSRSQSPRAPPIQACPSRELPPPTPPCLSEAERMLGEQCGHPVQRARGRPNGGAQHLRGSVVAISWRGFKKSSNGASFQGFAQEGVHVQGRRQSSAEW